MIPGPKIFRSRWSAVIWAGGILWFALDVAGAAPPAKTDNTVAAADTDATETVIANADLAVLANAMPR